MSKIKFIYLLSIIIHCYPYTASAQESSSPQEKSEQKTPVSFNIDNTYLSLSTPLRHLTPGPTISLPKALEKADKQNLSLAGARLEIDKAHAALKKSWGLIFPVINGSFEYTRMDHEDTVDLAGSMTPLLDAIGIALPPDALGEPIVTNPMNTLRGSVQLYVPLINFESWATVSTAHAGVEVAELSIENARRKLLLGTANAYHMTLMAQELIHLYEFQVHSASVQLNIAQARFEAGQGMRIDVVRAKVDLKNAHQQLLAAHTSYDNAREALGILIGTNDLPIPQEHVPITEPARSEIQFLDDAASFRIDLKAKEATVSLYEKQLKTSRMHFLPTLSAAWQGSYTFTDLPDMGSGDKSRWAMIFTLSIPIYDHFRYGDLDEKRAAVAQARLALDDAHANMTQEVRRAYRNYKTELESVDLATEQAELAKEGLELAESAFKVGSGTSIDVTVAREAYTSARVNWATTKLKAQMALLTLLESSGEDLLTLAQKHM